MNKVLFTTFVVMLSLGIALYIHQDSNADRSETSIDGRVVGEASASCGSNSASAELSIDYAEDVEKQDGDSYTGSGYCYAQAGPNEDRDPDVSGTRQFWLKAKRKSFLCFSWISVDREVIDAGTFFELGSRSQNTVNTSATASGTLDSSKFGDVNIYDECSTS